MTVLSYEKCRCISDATGRRDKFRTRTLITPPGTKRKIIKQAGSEKAMAFLNKIIDRERFAQRYLNGVFDVITGRMENGCIIYDFLPFETFQDRIGHLLNTGQHVRAHALFAEYVTKLDCLKRCICKPMRFYNTIAQDTGVKRQLDCFVTGIIDLIPRNILLIKSKWIVLDNEWCFNFTVPVKFVKFRAIRELALSLQGPIRNSTCQGNCAISVFGSGVNVYYVPDAWLEYIDVDGPSMERMLRWEAGFQKYVLGDNVHVGRIIQHQRVRTRFLLAKLPVAKGIKQAADKIPGFKETIRKAERRLLLTE